MKSERLFEKYSDGRHWENHPVSYSESFGDFLKSVDFNGLLVDVGCGDGRDINILSKYGFDVIGIDCSEKEIELARKRFPELRFEVQDAENLEFDDNSVSAFFMINVIHYTDQNKTIGEIFRSLEGGGYLFVHFNLKITDKHGKIDYSQGHIKVMELVSQFKILKKRVLERVDNQPIQHTHRILELILQKP